MKFNFYAMVLATAFSANASATMFDELGAKFETARATTIAEATGWHSGRCFLSSEPDDAYAGILFVVDRVTGQDPKVTPYEHRIIVGPDTLYGRPADRFDNPPKDYLDLLQSMTVDAYYGSKTAAVEKDGSLMNEYTNIPGGVNRVRTLEEPALNKKMFLVQIAKDDKIFANCWMSRKIHD